MIDPSLLDVTILVRLEPFDLQVLGHALCEREALNRAVTNGFRGEVEPLDWRPPTAEEIETYCREQLRKALNDLAIGQSLRMGEWRRQQRVKREGT